MKSTKVALAVLGMHAMLTNSSTLGAEEHWDKINIVVPPWDSGRLIANYIASEVERSFDKKVNFLDIKTDEMWIEADKPDGKADIFPDLWMPNRITEWSKYIDERGTVRANVAPYNGRQDLYFLTNDALQGEISIESLNDPEIVKLFDSDGNGKGEYWPSVEGWGSYTYTEVKIHNYGMTDLWEPLSQTSDEFLVTLEERAKSGVSVLFYYWEPEWVHEEYELGNVIEPPYEEGCQNVIDPKESDDYLEKSTFMCEYPKSEVYVVYRSNIDEKAEGLDNFLSTFSVDPATLSKALYVLYQDRDDMDGAVAILSAASN